MTTLDDEPSFFNRTRSRILLSSADAAAFCARLLFGPSPRKRAVSAGYLPRNSTALAGWTVGWATLGLFLFTPHHTGTETKWQAGLARSGASRRLRWTDGFSSITRGAGCSEGPRSYKGVLRCWGFGMGDMFAALTRVFFLYFWLWLAHGWTGKKGHGHVAFLF